jgi:hypothetical protein
MSDISFPPVKLGWSITRHGKIIVIPSYAVGSLARVIRIEDALPIFTVAIFNICVCRESK